VLFETADELGYGKVAFGHNKDDVVETIMMNLIYNGEISSINPVQELFGGKIKIIRPLILLEEKEIVRYTKISGIETIKTLCPRSYDSKRAVIKRMIYDLYRNNKDIKTNILRAPARVKNDYISYMYDEEF
jgi:tRNA 2-thiocytidine biosynthesis protein TtcA